LGSDETDLRHEREAAAVAQFPLLGRERELDLIEGFLSSAAFQGDALVLIGEPGIGKTALLRAARRHAEANGRRVLVGAGVEFEAEVSFSALNQVLLPLSDQFANLTPLYREALNVALGFGEGPPPDRLIVSNAALSLLQLAARENPMLLLIDDLQWLDRASARTLGFVAQRVQGSRVGLLGALRTGADSFFDRSVPEHELEALDDETAVRLLRTHFPNLARRALQRVLTEAQGNPLALLELPAALGPDRTSDASALPSLLPLNHRLQRLFAREVDALPAATRRLLLLGALDGTGDPRVLRASGASDEHGLAELAPAEEAGLARLDEATHRLTFRHPLIRSAIVEGTTAAERRAAHDALAKLWQEQPDRRAWHLAQAATSPDEQVASLLEEAARRSERRGDGIGAVAGLVRAAELSPSAKVRAQRLAYAAYIGAEETGDLNRASVLLADARRADPELTGSLRDASAAVFLLLNAEGDVVTAHRLLVSAIESTDHGYDANNPALVEAMHNLLLVCWFGSAPELWKPFYDALARLEPVPPDFLSVASRTFADPVRTAPAALEDFDALASTLRDEPDPARVVRIGTASVYVDRLADSRAASWQLVRRGREGGPARRHLAALMHLCLDSFLTGRWDDTYELAEEGVKLCDSYGYSFFKWYFLYGLALIEGGRGDSAASHGHTEDMIRWARPRGVRAAELFAAQARSLAAIGESDFESAFRYASALSPAGTLASHVPHALWGAFDLVEAAMKTGRRAEARAHVSALGAANVAAISSRMTLVQLGSAALVADSASAGELFDRALAVPGADAWQFDHARIRLAYGEHLRRARALSPARLHLSTALETFDRLGARPWALRAAAELRATGQTPRAGDHTRASLTPQEREIALLAASGLTNKQIGERLFLSHRTIANHLHRIFPKLGITARAALRDALDGSSDAHVRSID
jgi:DNA-binding CsgD family transcriptional regulator